MKGWSELGGGIGHGRGFFSSRRGLKFGTDAGGGGFPGDPHSPPMGPGPQGTPGAPMPPAALPQQESQAWKYVLIGCGVLLLLALVVGGGTCYYMAKKAPEMMSGLMELGASELTNVLTPDHDDEQRERFETLVNAVMSEELERLGMIKWAQNYQEVLDELNRIAQDEQITVEESEQWCDKAYFALEKAGYWEEEE